MSHFFSKKYDSLVAYTPGEQPLDKKYVKLNTNESPFPPSPFASRLARQEAGNLELYSDPEVRDLIKIAAEKFEIAENEIVFTNGSDDILNFAFMAFCDDEHPAAFADITYGFYSVFAEANRVPYVEIPLCDDFTINVEDYIGINKTIFIANPNAPTGIALGVKDIERVISSNPNNVVIIDEAYVDFGAESCKNLIHKYDNLLVTQTFSKSRSLAGGRLGFGMGNEKLIADINTLRYSANPYSVNRMTMAAGIGALSDDKYFKDCVGEIIKIREFYMDELKELGFEMTDSKANFIFAKHPKMSGEDIYLKLKDKGILIRHFKGGRLDDYNRITVGSTDQMEILVEALKEILA